MNIKNKVRSSYPSNAQWINNTISVDEITDLTHFTCMEAGKPSHMLAERILQDYAVTCLPSSIQRLNTTEIKYDGKLAKKDLEYLNLKLDAVRKTITAGDVYNIKGVAESEEDVDHMKSVATPNTAFISNVRVEKNNIAPGDIVFTDLNNQTHIIQHAAAGYFYPARGERLQEEVQQSDGTKKNEFTNTYQLTYSGSTTDPQKTNLPVQIDDTLTATAFEQMFAEMDTGTSTGFARTYKLQPGTSSDHFNYPDHLEKQPFSSVPLVTVLSSEGEKIGIDDVLSKNDNGTGQLNNPTSMIIYVEVR